MKKTNLIFAILLLFSITAFFFSFDTSAAPASGSLNHSYNYYQRFNVTNQNTTANLSSGYSVNFTFNHSALVLSGKSQANGGDVRIGYWNGTEWNEVHRALDVSSNWSSGTTKIWFQTQANITANTNDSNYFLYYGNSSTSNPFYENKSEIVSENLTLTKVMTRANSVLNINHGTFSNDGVDFWAAAPGYSSAYAADSWYAFTGYPSYFNATQVKNFSNKFITLRDGNGSFPISIATGGASGSFYSGCDIVTAHVTGDAMFFVPMMQRMYYNMSGDTSYFSSTSRHMKTALATIPRNATSKLVSVNLSDIWIPWGFQDGINTTGDVLMGSLLYYKAATDLAALYTAVNDTENATFYTNEAGNISASIPLLWNSSYGMFNAATGQNKQVDILGSAYAVYLGFLPSNYTTNISNYLVSNYSSIVTNGYVDQTPGNWAFSMNALGNNQCGRGTGNYDDGQWSVGHEWIANAMLLTNQSRAIQLIQDYSNNIDPSKEYYGASTNGFTQNTASLMGPLRFIQTQSALFPNVSTNITSSNYSNVFLLWDDFNTTKSNWSNYAGTWAVHKGAINQTTTTDIEDTKRNYNVGLSNNLLMQSDLRVNSFTAGDHSSLGICLNSLDTGATTARGYCSTFRGNDQTTVAILNAQVAWGSGSAFTWTTNTWYRTQIARIGPTIYRKTWVLGSAEPSAWQETYTQSNNLASTSVGLLGGYSTTSFDNVIVRRYNLVEPSVSFSSETLNNINISSVNSSDVTSTSATIAWTTQKSATTKLHYGLNSSYGSNTTETDTSTLVNSHSVSLTGLSACTTYHYLTNSRDELSDEENSTDQTFTTSGCTESSNSTESNGTSDSTGIPTIRSFPIITPLLPAITKISNAQTGINEIRIEVNEVMDTVTVNFKSLGASAPSTSKKITGNVYQYAEIEASNIDYSKINSVEIKFSVKKEWITGNGFDEDEIFLKRFSNGEWQRLETNVISSLGSEIQYSATTPGFSYYAIVGEKLDPSSSETNPEDSSTNEGEKENLFSKKNTIFFSVVLILILLVAYLDWSRLNKKRFPSFKKRR